MALIAVVFSTVLMIWFAFRFQALNKELRDTIDKCATTERVTERSGPSNELLDKVKAIALENRALKARIAELESSSEQDAAGQPATPP